MKILQLVVSFLLVSLFSVEARADEYIVRGAEARGGNTQYFLNGIKSFRKYRMRVVLPASCLSSCTLYTALLRDDLLCARSDTVLIFHQFFYTKDEEVDAQGRLVSFGVDRYVSGGEKQHLWMTYPISVRRAILSHSPRGLPLVGNELTLPARELGIPAC